MLATSPVSRSSTRTDSTVSATSCPYAPTFWIGVAPTEPGIPDRHSKPWRPSSTQRATSSSQASPAATVSRAPSRSTPRVATRTTLPSTPASAITTFEPPASTSAASRSACSTSSASSRPRRTRRRPAEPQRGQLGEFHTTGPAVSTCEPSGRPSTCCAARRGLEQRLERDAGLDAHLVQHRHEVLGRDVAGRARAARGSRRARRSSTRSSLTPASSAASTFASPCPRVLWKWAVSSTSSPSASRAAGKNSRTCAGLAIPVVSPKPISCAPASISRRAIANTRSGGTWPS